MECVGILKIQGSRGVEGRRAKQPPSTETWGFWNCSMQKSFLQKRELCHFRVGRGSGTVRNFFPRTRPIVSVSTPYNSKTSQCDIPPVRTRQTAPSPTNDHFERIRTRPCRNLYPVISIPLGCSISSLRSKPMSNRKLMTSFQEHGDTTHTFKI